MTNHPLISSENTLISSHIFCEVRKSVLTGEHALLSTQYFKPGEMVSTFSAKDVLESPNYLTVQTGVDQHITLFPEYLQYINHSCNPNIFFNTTSMQLICLREITPGDEFHFFYPSTEWDMAQSFNCHCGATDCIGVIKGAKYLSSELLNKYRLSDFIHSQRH